MQFQVLRKSENLSDSSLHRIFYSENFRFPFSTKNSLSWGLKCEKLNRHLEIFSLPQVTENCRQFLLPLPTLYDIFFQAQPVVLHRKGEGSSLFKRIRILINQQQQQHHIFFMDVSELFSIPTPRHPTTTRCSRAICFLNSSYFF